MPSTVRSHRNPTTDSASRTRAATRYTLLPFGWVMPHACHVGRCATHALCHRLYRGTHQRPTLQVP